MQQRPIRVLMAKVGLDGHDRGVKVTARALRDAGFEVIYTGLHRMPQEVVEAAIQEDVDVLGVSILSGAHMTLVPPILEELRARRADDILVCVGGVFPPEDIEPLKQAGVAAVFDQESTTAGIIDWMRAAVAEKRR
ncbi:MAG: cobalamin B12-binding domain-containing protein [Chloroflexota bacterium]